MNQSFTAVRVGRYTLPNRLVNNADRASFFGGAAQGYTDYPALEAAEAA
jgi:hypothetical protein